jgi:bifunctional non-homologous end joining protein LigD
MPEHKRQPLEEYRAKRDFTVTSEPLGEGAPAPRFVVQEHHATRLHWDLRLEHGGVAVSWAIPNGIPLTPRENRLAVHTEDHPLQYLEFEGEIPNGSYGAGTMRIWDRGTFETVKWEQRKVELIFHGERLHGRYGLFPIGRADEQQSDWMIHRMDPPEDPSYTPMPEHVAPMLARAGGLPAAPEEWSFEVKWDGVRAIAYARPGRLRLESRNGRELTDSYPEVRGLLRDLGMHEAVLDGEIVAFDATGRPSFEVLQRRMHVTAPAALRRLTSSTPVVYAIFDLLHLDGRSLTGLPYAQRRAALEQLALNGPAWRVPAARPGAGAALLQATATAGLEGVVAKRLDSRYTPGARSGAWLKIKHTRRQELVIGGWLPGAGKRAQRIGALLMGYHEAGELRYAGRVGTGFTELVLADLAARLAPLRQPDSPFTPAPKLPREAQFVTPLLVAEVEFIEWTSDGVMRAPSFKGLRDDKDPAEVVREDAEVVREDAAEAVREDSDQAVSELQDASGARASGAQDRRGREPADLFDGCRQREDGTLAVSVDGRALKLSNWDKVLFPQTGFTKGELIAYYTLVAPAVVPHLSGRALTLKRYPNGVEAEYFYEKQSPSHRPGWVPTARIGGVDYTLAQERAALVWLANLADIELHTSLSLAAAPQRPTMLVFDLDPGAPAGIVECCEVALVLQGMFAALGAQTLAKTSGSKGLQVYLPLNSDVSYEQTKPFAKHVAELLEQRLGELVVSRMTKRLRAGRVLVDWSQNDAHKTTVTVYSMRALPEPSVSTPVSWDEVRACRAAARPELLRFGPEQVLARIAEHGDLFAGVLSARQRLPSLD